MTIRTTAAMNTIVDRQPVHHLDGGVVARAATGQWDHRSGRVVWIHRRRVARTRDHPSARFPPAGGCVWRGYERVRGGAVPRSLEIRVNSHFFDDFFGALIAYDAFEQIIRGKQRRRIEGFTPEQRFFLGAAQSVWGGALTEESISASHSATRWRVYTNGTLSAMPGFAMAFGCKKGDRMAGGHVWYRAPWYGVTLTPDQQRARYREYYIDHYTEIARGFFSDANYLAQAMHVELTEAQAAKLSQIAATTHRTQWDALAESLRPVSDNADGNRQILRLLAGRLKDLRTDLELTPEQQGTFDQLRQVWMRQYLPGD